MPNAQHLLIHHLLFLILALPVAAAAETTITYQGQLQENGQPLTDTPDMTFRLYDSPSGGNQIGNAESLSGVPIEDGLFQVELDFGPGAFNGSERYLEVDVAGDTLSPRQKITGAPTAQHALEVAAGSVGSEQIAAGAVGPDQLESDSLTIASGNGLQGGGEVALDGSVTISIADGGVGSTQIAPGAVGAGQLADGLEGKWTENGGRLQPKAGEPDSVEVGEVHANTVEALTSSTGSDAAGVRGSSTGNNYGVDGRVYVDESSLPALSDSESAGVFGRTDKAAGWGVAAWSRNGDGLFTRTDDENSYALLAFNSEPNGYAVLSEGNLEVDGHANVARTGVSAHLSANQTIQNGISTTVVFDETNADDFNGYDTSTGQYTVQEDGTYHVSFTIDWQTNFNAGVNIDYELHINGDFQGGIQADTSVGTNGQRISRGFSRTLFGLSEGDTLEVVVSQDSGATADIWGSNQETYLTIFKAG